MAKEKKYHFIYKTTNILTGRYYYGMHSTYNLDDGYLGSGKRLRYSIRKYDEENHKREIIEFMGNREKLKQREKEIVNLNEIAKEKCMNLMVGGEGGYHKNCFGGREGSSRGGKKSGRIVGIINLRKGPPAIKEKIKNGTFFSMRFTGKKHIELSKKLIGQKNSIHQSGSGNSQYGTCWIYSLELKKSKKIKKEELENYSDEGWTKGRKMKF